MRVFVIVSDSDEYGDSDGDSINTQTNKSGLVSWQETVVFVLALLLVIVATSKW